MELDQDVNQADQLGTCCSSFGKTLGCRTLAAEVDKSRCNVQAHTCMHTHVHMTRSVLVSRGRVRKKAEVSLCAYVVYMSHMTPSS